MSDLQKLLALMILKAAPQDLAYSPQIAVRYAVIYILSGLMVLQTTLSPSDMLPGMVLALLIQCVFIYVVLVALSFRARFVQTIAAVLGVGVLFNIMSWPILSVLANDASAEPLKSTMSLFFLLLISWEVLVKAHIFKHALEIKMFSSLALSFSLFFISIALSQLIFPAAAG